MLANTEAWAPWKLALEKSDSLVCPPRRVILGQFPLFLVGLSLLIFAPSGFCCRVPRFPLMVGLSFVFTLRLPWRDVVLQQTLRHKRLEQKGVAVLPPGGDLKS